MRQFARYLKYLVAILSTALFTILIMQRVNSNANTEEGSSFAENDDDSVENRTSSLTKGQEKKGLFEKMSKRDSILQFSLDLLGTDYCYASETEEEGFDCSGFTYYVFKNFGIQLPRSSTYQAQAGTRKQYGKSIPGDLLIFTGTDANDRTPGHVGIVYKRLNDTISFIHSSSNRGVIISQVEGTGYEKRFLEVRDVIGN